MIMAIFLFPALPLAGLIRLDWILQVRAWALFFFGEGGKGGQGGEIDKPTDLLIVSCFCSQCQSRGSIRARFNIPGDSCNGELSWGP